MYVHEDDRVPDYKHAHDYEYDLDFDFDYWKGDGGFSARRGGGGVSR